MLFRDWPIFGKESVNAARFAVASKYQGNMSLFHMALMKEPRPLTDARIRPRGGQGRGQLGSG